MPTTDERREVAARLRDYSTRNFDESSPWLYMSKALTGSFTAYDDASDLFIDLADLIEPEPERTCHIEIVKQGPLYITYRFDCCGGEWTESMTDAGATDLPGTVCPFCGAKVN